MNRRVSTQDISWFLDLNANDQLHLDPPYQRRSVWTLKDRKAFLDTIFRDYPCPAIFLHKTTSQKGKQIYHVVDGKQRLETVLKFANNEISISKDYGNSDLDGKKWRHIEKSTELKKRFWDYVFSVEFIDTTEGTIINDVFDRLNRNARKLERQEIRHAKFDGWFITTAEIESEKEEWEELQVVTKARIRRMKDVQFISELLIVLLKGRIDGFDQDYIDEIYAEYDSIETLSAFSEDIFINSLEATKKYLLALEQNKMISKYAKGLGNFYTLWFLIAVNGKKLPTTKSFEKKYSTFMEIVGKIEKERNPDKFIQQHMKKKTHKEAFRYFNNSRGASTDQLQRKERYSALKEVIL